MKVAIQSTSMSGRLLCDIDLQDTLSSMLKKFQDLYAVELKFAGLSMLGDDSSYPVLRFMDHDYTGLELDTVRLTDLGISSSIGFLFSLGSNTDISLKTQPVTSSTSLPLPMPVVSADVVQSNVASTETQNSNLFSKPVSPDTQHNSQLIRTASVFIASTHNVEQIPAGW